MLFLKKTAPTQDSSTYSTAYHSIFGILAGALTNDYKSFCTAVNCVQETEWKASEIKLYGSAISDAMNELKNLGCDAVGMSSLGPTVYYFSADSEKVATKIRQKFPHATVQLTNPRNMGREIVFD